MSNPTLSVIFDMDGVLVDTVKYNWQAINEVLSDYGIHVPDDELGRYIGRPLRSQLEQISGENNIELDYDLISQQITPIRQKLLGEMKPKEGVTRLLDSLKSNSVPIAVATSNSRDETIRRLTFTGIIDYFSVLVTEDDVTEHKPSPAIYLEAARQLNATPKDCLVFEDAPAGISAAKNAGMICIAVRTHFINTKDLEIADEVVDSLEKVNMELIRNTLRNEVA